MSTTPPATCPSYGHCTYPKCGHFLDIRATSIPFHPIPGLEAEEISGHAWHVATGEPNPCIHERMWWPTVPGELE